MIQINTTFIYNNGTMINNTYCDLSHIPLENFKCSMLIEHLKAPLDILEFVCHT